MTRPTAIDPRHDGGAAVEEVAWVDTAAPHLAAIEHDYQEAKANIVDPARFPSYPPLTCRDPLPATEKIDVRAVRPPVPDRAVRAVGTRGVAARSRADRPVTGGMRSPAGPPVRQRLARRRSWGGIRTAFQALLAPNS